MPLTHAAFRYEFGIVLHERGMNRISVGLRRANPNLFAASTEIPLKAPEDGDPGHTLTLYAVINEPPLFNLAPIDGEVGLDRFLVQADLSFSLTDSQLGTITRLGCAFQALGTAVVVDNHAQIRVDRFVVTDLRGEHPDSVAIVGDAIDAGVAVATTYGLDAAPDTLARTFRALVNYLIKVFLEAGLKKPIAKFPLPALNDLVEINLGGTIAVREALIRQDAVYVAMGDETGAPVQFPGPYPTIVDLRLGVSQKGLRRIVNSNLPFAIDVSSGTPDDTFQMWSPQDAPFELWKADVAIPPQGIARIETTLFFRGVIILRINVTLPVIGKRIRIDIPFPIDKLSHYAGNLYPHIHRDQDIVALRLYPDTSYLGNWRAVILTEYRNYLAAQFREWVQNNRPEPVKKFCKIPIIGWIVCGVIDLAAWLLGYLLGAVLDFVLSVSLTVLMNTIGRVILGGQNFKLELATLEQKELLKEAGVTIAEAAAVILPNGVDGELDLLASFDPQGLPVPVPPAPWDELPPVPLPPAPVYPDLPEHEPAAFRPALVLSRPAWVHNQRQTFELEAMHDGTTLNAIADFVFERTGSTWVLQKSVRKSSGSLISTLTARFTGERLQLAQEEGTAVAPDGSVHSAVRYTFDTAPGTAQVRLESAGEYVDSRVVDLQSDTPVLNEELWAFSLAHATLSDGMAGKFARLELRSPAEYRNWARIVPVAVSVQATTIPNPAGTGQLPVWRTTAVDEEGRTELIIDAGGRGVLELVWTGGADRLTMKRR